METPSIAWRRACDVVAAGSAAVVVASLLAAGNYRAHVRFSHTTSIAATTAAAVLAGAAVVAALVGRRRPVLGLLGGAGVSAAAAASWLLLGDHRLDGPVILAVAREHGVHIGDFLAVVPATISIALATLAVMAGIRSKVSGRRPRVPSY